MIRDTLQASVQYGDWKGTAAADEFGGGSEDFDELFEAAGEVDPEKEIMIGFSFSILENSVYLVGFFHPKSESTRDGWTPSLAHDFAISSGPIRVKQVKVEITSEVFFKHLKRFNVVLVRGGLTNIIGRDIEAEED